MDISFDSTDFLPGRGRKWPQGNRGTARLTSSSCLRGSEEHCPTWHGKHIQNQLGDMQKRQPTRTARETDNDEWGTAGLTLVWLSQRVFSEGSDSFLFGTSKVSRSSCRAALQRTYWLLCDGASLLSSLKRPLLFKICACRIYFLWSWQILHLLEKIPFIWKAKPLSCAKWRIRQNQWRTNFRKAFFSFKRSYESLNTKMQVLRYSQV